MAKNSVKRPQKGEAPPRRELMVADTLKQAAGHTGYSVEFLQRLKDDGCTAFRHGRVYLAELQSHLVDHPEQEREDSLSLMLLHVELRNELTKLAEREQKLYERRKLFAKGEDVKRSLVKAWLAMKVKLHAMAVKLSQPLSMINEPRDIQKNLDAEICSVLGQVEKNEWFDVEEAAQWLATQPEILKRANELAKK
jgi:hypothetical protein